MDMIQKDTRRSESRENKPFHCEQSKRENMETVRNGGDVSVSSLSEMLQVSPLTIRRDLQYLEEHKLLERFYGGARTGNAEVPRKNSRELRKERIAKYGGPVWWRMETAFF